MSRDEFSLPAARELFRRRSSRFGGDASAELAPSRNSQAASRSSAAATRNSPPWDRERVAEGEQHLACARALHRRGAYMLQAEIASVHMAEPLGWPELVAIYTELSRLVPLGTVELNRAIAVAEVAGPEAALAIVERIHFESPEVDHYRSLHSTRADLLRQLGRTIDARYPYGRALQLTRSEPERRFLKRRIVELPLPAAADWEAFWDSTLDAGSRSSRCARNPTLRKATVFLTPASSGRGATD